MSHDPFIYARTVRLAADLRREAKGLGVVPWHRLTDAQKVHWIVVAYGQLTNK